MAAHECVAILRSTGEPCGAASTATIHSRKSADPDRHPHLDARGAAKLAPQSSSRTAYLASEEHQGVYAAAKSADVAEGRCIGHIAGAPGECSLDRVPHHIGGRGANGGQPASERKYPVVMICSHLNSAIEASPQTRRWAERTTFERDGTEWPFRIANTSKRPASPVASRERD